MVTELWLQNYGYRILSPSIYDDAEKLRFIGILAYPKTHNPNIQIYNLVYMPTKSEQILFIKMIKSMTTILFYYFSMKQV
jgi:hypothetical protein